MLENVVVFFFFFFFGGGGGKICLDFVCLLKAKVLALKLHSPIYIYKLMINVHFLSVSFDVFCTLFFFTFPFPLIVIVSGPHGLTFTWWGCCHLCFFNISQPSLPTPFYSVLVTVSVFMALSTVFHPLNSPANSPLSHSVLPVSFLPFNYISLYESLLQSLYNP